MVEQSRHLGRRFGRLIGRLVVRLWALLILAVLVWCGYAAVAYMVRTVFAPTSVPPQFLTVATQPSVEDLERGRLWAVSAGAQRPALGHYHHVERGFEPDPHNGCLTSGCHSALPHLKKKETRALANFHATFLNCQMCHDARAHGTVAAMWVNNASGQAQEAPPLLQLLKFLEVSRERIADEPAEVHSQITALLEESLRIIGGDPMLEYLLIQIETSEPGSPMWRLAVSQLISELPGHARGEYGAKLWERVTDLEEQHEQLAALARKYLEAAPGPGRTSLHKEIHAAVLAKPEACLTCHGGEPPRLDFAALGYSEERARLLRSNPIARMVQTLREGGTFHLPELLNGGQAPPTTQGE